MILKNPIEVVDKTISELAEEAGVSLASISRFCKTLGLAGFHQLKIELARVSEKIRRRLWKRKTLAVS